MSLRKDGVVGKAVAYRTGHAPHREATLRVWGALHGGLQDPRVETARLARAGTGVLCKAHE